MGAKTYYSKTMSGRFPFSWGTEALFLYGRYVTENEREQAELDAIIPPKGNNPNIYTAEQLGIETAPHVDAAQNARSEREIASGEQLLRHNANNAGLQTRVQQETAAPNTGLPTNVNESTIDTDLQRAAFGNVTEITEVPKVVGPGAQAAAERVAKLREEAAARATALQNSQTSVS